MPSGQAEAIASPETACRPAAPARPLQTRDRPPDATLRACHVFPNGQRTCNSKGRRSEGGRCCRACNDASSSCSMDTSRDAVSSVVVCVYGLLLQRGHAPAVPWCCWLESKAGLMSSPTLSRPQKPTMYITCNIAVADARHQRTVPRWFLQALFGLCISNSTICCLHESTGLKERATLHGCCLLW